MSTEMTPVLSRDNQTLLTYDLTSGGYMAVAVVLTVISGIGIFFNGIALLVFSRSAIYRSNW